jgi:hypothetical protein
MLLHACLQFHDRDFGFLGNIEGDLAVNIYARYQDEACARREGIAHCWITDCDFQPILGRPPADWFPDSPMRENGGKRTAARELRGK